VSSTRRASTPCKCACRLRITNTAERRTCRFRTATARCAKTAHCGPVPMQHCALRAMEPAALAAAHLAAHESTDRLHNAVLRNHPAHGACIPGADAQGVHCAVRPSRWLAVAAAGSIHSSTHCGTRHAHQHTSLGPPAALTGQQGRVEHVVAGAHQHQLVGAILCGGQGGVGLKGDPPHLQCTGHHASSCASASTRHFCHAPLPCSPPKARGSMFLMTLTAPHPLPSTTTRVLVAVAALPSKGGARAGTRASVLAAACIVQQDTRVLVWDAAAHSPDWCLP